MAPPVPRAVQTSTGSAAHRLGRVVPPRLWVRKEGIVRRAVKQTQLCLVLHAQRRERRITCAVENPLRMIEVDDQIRRLGAVGLRV